MEEISFATKIFIGADAMDRLKILHQKRILIICDPFIESSGMLDYIVEHLASDNVYKVFSDIVPDPPTEKVAAGLSVTQEFKPQIIIAVGGGSAIDTAKAIKEFYLKLLPEQEEITFIAIPTTSGTGSEVTSFSVITDLEKKVKYPLVSNSLLPQEAILDINLVKSVPPAITADTGLDVLTHAIEAYVSNQANDFSDALAEKAAQLIFDYLPRAYHDGNDLEARAKVHHASCLAGMAFNLAGLGINHSIAHACGAQFHIPHGRMNAILLSAVIEYNAELIGYGANQYGEAAKKYAKLAKILGFSVTNVRSGVKSFIQRINNLQKNLNMPTNLRSCGITYEQMMSAKEAISKAAIMDRCTNTNPRIPSEDEIKEIVESIY